MNDAIIAFLGYSAGRRVFFARMMNGVVFGWTSNGLQQWDDSNYSICRTEEGKTEKYVIRSLICERWLRRMRSKFEARAKKWKNARWKCGERETHSFAVRARFAMKGRNQTRRSFGEKNYKRVIKNNIHGDGNGKLALIEIDLRQCELKNERSGFDHIVLHRRAH